MPLPGTRLLFVDLHWGPDPEVHHLPDGSSIHSAVPFGDSIRVWYFGNPGIRTVEWTFTKFPPDVDLPNQVGVWSCQGVVTSGDLSLAVFATETQ